MLKKIRHDLALGLLICGTCLLVWATIPVKDRVRVQTVLPQEMRLPNDEQAPQAVVEVRQVRLEWPGSMRIGDEGKIMMTFEPSQEGSGYAGEVVELRNVYDSYNLMAEGRFEAAGIRVDPANPVRESLPEGQRVQYQWKMRVDKQGNYTGRVWLLLRYLPLDGRPASQTPIYVSEVDIRAISLGGISGPLARLLGGLGVALGVLLNYNVMMSWTNKKISEQTQRSQKL
jgi:hypothetical protein